MSTEEPRDDTSPDSPGHADPAHPDQPAPADEPGGTPPAEPGGATPYAEYGSPGVHPLPGPAKRLPSPDGAGEPVPGRPSGGDPWAGQPYPPTPPPPQGYYGPAYPGGTYPAPPYPPGQPVYPGYPGSPTPPTRPGQVTAGVIMSWVGGGVFALLGVLLLALADNKDLLDGVEQQLGNQLNRDQATTIFRTLGVGLGVWGIAVIVFAVLAWNGKNWARIALTVMGGLYCASQLVGIVSGAVAGLPFLAYVVICVGLLWTRQAGAWFTARSYDAAGGPNRPPPIVW